MAALPPVGAIPYTETSQEIPQDDTHSQASMRRDTDTPTPHGPLKRLATALLAGLGLVVGLAAAPTPASAESNVHGNVNLKFGPYFPRIDEEFSGGEAPFADSFGKDNRVLANLSAEWYLFEGHGKLGVGGSFGYTSFKGGTSGDSSSDGSGGDGSDNGMDDGSGDGSETSGDLTVDEEFKFRVFPLGTHVSYRWDYLAQEFNIPLAPKVEAGLDYYLWRAVDPGGNTSEFDGEKASGARLGYHLTGRMELQLDFIDPQWAAAFDVSWGINNTYLFAE